MDFTDSDAVKNTTINACLEIGIEKFHSSKIQLQECKYVDHRHGNQNFKVRFAAEIFTNGVDEATEGWLEIRSFIDVYDEESRPRDCGALFCTVSVIDIEGNSRFRKPILKIPSDRTFGSKKYLKRSFILDRENELLPEGVLTLLCEFLFDFNDVAPLYQEEEFEENLKEFLLSIPQTHLSNTFKVFDFSFQILTLPSFHRSRRRFGVHDALPSSPSLSLETEERDEALQHVWIFDTSPHRFFLSLDERQDSVGVRLLRSSPVIRGFVNDPTNTERLEKQIQLVNVSSRTFIIVLYFLIKGELAVSESRDFLEVYTMSRFYEMEELRQKCSWKMGMSFELLDEREVKRVVDLYSDEYLSTLFDSRKKEYEDPKVYLSSIPQAHCIRIDAEKGHTSDVSVADSEQNFTVFDFTFRILTLPQFHESRKRFDVYGIAPSSLSQSSASKEDSTDRLDHVWMFDTQTDRFLLPLDEGRDSVGARLLGASPVIKRMVNTPMKERRDKCIRLSNWSSLTFISVLSFLEKRELRTFEFRDLLDLHTISHMYELIELQQKCSEKLINALEYPNEFEELERVIDLYSDETLSLFLDRHFTRFLASIPQADCIDNNAETGHPNDIGTADSSKKFTVYDLTLKILTLPQFHESRKRFGVYGISPESSWIGSEPKEDSTNNLQHVWMFDTRTDRFLLSFDEGQDSLGTQLLKTSAFIRRCIEIPMKEKREKHIKSRNISTLTFMHVLHVLESGSFPSTRFCDLMDIYEMCHFFQLERLQEYCTRELLKRSEYQSQFKELKEIASFYSDEYLSKLLDSRVDTFEYTEHLRTDDKANYDCYI